MVKTEEKRRFGGWAITAIALMLLSAILIFALSTALINNKKSSAALERTYEQNLYDLSDNLNNVEVNLSKLMVAPEGKFAAELLTDVYGGALAAEKALATLPIDFSQSQQTSAFLNKIADFATSYQSALISGKTDNDYYEMLENMYTAVHKLNSQLSDSVSRATEGKLDMRKVTAEAPYTFRTKERSKHDSVEYPELIYDGPFSDGRAADDYKLLNSLPQISLKEAKDIALGVLPDFKLNSIASAGKSEEEPFYLLSAKGERGEAYFTVSERGGKIINLTVFREMGTPMLGEESATACAKEFAAKLGYNVQPVWYLSSGGCAYVNLAPIVDGIVYYTDLVKVKVALDNGEIMGMDAKNYCLNNEPRQLGLTMNRAAVPTLIDGKLNIKKIRGALIPLEGGKQRLCYEADCEYKGLDYFVYLDAANGETVKIMRVVDAQQGKLVM